ncbi:unnamed protein product [Prorocentrum cordatum]|uniref:Uncharacterized protein n=1 Tax=Prorocentrum cordatum TaxID=2364126 RepID=A0ABN9Y864_9DINO|nr:unnamed protein product [Polarella glacialis]
MAADAAASAELVGEAAGLVDAKALDAEWSRKPPPSPAKERAAATSKKPPRIPTRPARRQATETTEAPSDHEVDRFEGDDARLDDHEDSRGQAEPGLREVRGAAGGLALTSARVFLHTQLHSTAAAEEALHAHRRRAGRGVALTSAPDISRAGRSTVSEGGTHRWPPSGWRLLHPAR